jgi:hypothetical protein
MVGSTYARNPVKLTRFESADKAMTTKVRPVSAAAEEPTMT